MKVLVLSTTGDFGDLDLCLRAKADGHQIKWAFTATDRTRDIGKGLVDKVTDWRDFMRWADIVILTDNTKHLREMDAWRARGTPIVGASQESATWELNRTLAMKVFEGHGIAVPPYKEFSDYDEAIAYVKKEMRRFVSKPCGDEPDKSLSYVAKSPEDLIYMLGRWKKAQKLKGKFILQEFIPGCEMAVGAFIGPKGFMEGWHENWEFKKLMAGDLGPATGEQGTVLRVVQNSKLAKKVLAPLEDALVEAGHTGYVDVNCIIDDKGTPWPLEFTMRPGWPTFNIQQALLKGDTIQWLSDLSSGRDSKPWRQNEIACGVVLAIPDYPYSGFTKKEIVGVPIYGLKPSTEEAVHFCQVMQGSAPQEVRGKIVDAPCLLSAGDYLLVATGTGASVRLARERAYRVLKSLSIPCSPFWRTDIGQRLKKQLPPIQQHGFAAGMDF